MCLFFFSFAVGHLFTDDSFRFRFYQNKRKVMKMKYLVATVGSFVLTTAVITNAYYQKKQFYPSVVYITKSSPSMAVSQVLSTHSVVLCGAF